MSLANKLAGKVASHRCYTHPVFKSWIAARPNPDVIGAAFHQIQNFCAATRPGWNFPEALKEHGTGEQSDLMQAIVDSEENHGPQLATMAGYIVNRAAGEQIYRDLWNQEQVESGLKQSSDRLLGSLPGYDAQTGLAVQTKRAMAVFDRRKLTDRDSTFRNIGTAVALEMISNRHLIPGEKECLVDSGLYGVSMHETEMHYLLEHWGEIGAEHQHEQNALAAVAVVSDASAEIAVMKGADAFLETLSAVWDLIDSALLQSSHHRLAA